MALEAILPSSFLFFSLKDSQLQNIFLRQSVTPSSALGKVENNIFCIHIYIMFYSDSVPRPPGGDCGMSRAVCCRLTLLRGERYGLILLYYNTHSYRGGHRFLFAYRALEIMCTPAPGFLFHLFPFSAPEISSVSSYLLRNIFNSVLFPISHAHAYLLFNPLMYPQLLSYSYRT